MPRFYAKSRIRHGANQGDESKKVVVFEKGDLVTGLTAEEMKSLWNAGALRQEDDKSAETEESQTTTENP